MAGAVLAFAAAAATRRPGSVLAGSAIGLVLVAAVLWTPQQAGEPWVIYAVGLSSMLCLVISGTLDNARPRIVAGWLGMAGVIAATTWAVKGSLLRRSVFLAAAGGVAVMLSLLLNRPLPRTQQ